MTAVAPEEKPSELTDDGFLDGRIRAWQPKDGYRAAVDPVLLAAGVPARPGERVLELGMGSGIASLCLAHRVRTQGGPPYIIGIEKQANLARIAQRNVARNDLSGFVTVVEGDLTQPPALLKETRFDHAFANPPYLDVQKHMRSQNGERAGAHAASAGLTGRWIKTGLQLLRHKGTLTLIHEPSGVPEIIEALDGQAGSVQLFPLWPGSGKPAKRVIVRAVKGGRAPLTMHPGLVLHGDQGNFTDEAEQVLRQGNGLPLLADPPTKER